MTLTRSNSPNNKGNSTANRWAVADQNVTGAFQLAFKSMVFIDILIISYQALTHQTIDSQSTLLIGALGGILIAAVNYIMFVNKKELKKK
ncbi:hypothetical protein [Methanosarcina sp. UBA289]|uniref:hypothetical protein n=1 Tax=Methanosarcina sp. UBA289 TaxID=1915574 RepID=UPI0025DE0999|nr:hypothetical protein [Methanosarcina sp. UBA289]